MQRRYRVIRTRRGRLLWAPPSQQRPWPPPVISRHRKAHLPRHKRGRHLLWTAPVIVAPPTTTITFTVSPPMLRWSTGQMTSGSGGPTVSVMGALILSRLSTEYVIVPVSEQVDNAIGNPTGDVVQFAFTSGYGIVPSVWYTGTWDTTLVQGIWYNAKCLVGPGTGGVSLTAGTYTVWVKIASDPEVPVRQSGTLVIQ